eukprot:CAMPEP_0173155848 /NCGR_PEP_ID=MMETSP1105-20130129/14376_1 /TAXON_ID=2985 /ORGANISM="Ochromonas sp., Strain BG-1" /LENGTH=32 /DNA_ID= /DNA_START= /DNA_END= /DNA_ORIENTATION=
MTKDKDDFIKRMITMNYQLQHRLIVQKKIVTI